ncbi:MAG: cation-translocating P-type ATPase [Anaerolineales bacterium]
MLPWYQLKSAAVLENLEADPENGLSTAEANRRLEKYGYNEITEQKQRSLWAILWDQLASIMVLILVVAAGISFFLGDYEDAVVILLIVVLNAALGFQQEYKAEQSMAALKQMAVPHVRARRDGQVSEISSRELVPGDIVILETGNFVPADGRLLESVNLRIEEAALTGESVSVDKHAEEVFDSEKPLGDRRNVAYMGTVVTYGRGELIVTQTGMDTELGHIATMIQGVEQEKSPLQVRLDQVGKTLAVIALVIVAVIFGIGLLQGRDLEEMFLTSVSLAVAAVPEAMPAVATIALALGAQRMLKRRALFRKLPAVETLGSVNVICSDKTGTLTKNQMTVTVLDIANHRLDMRQSDDATGLEIVPLEAQEIHAPTQSMIDMLLIAGALCNDAILKENEDHPEHFQAVGDPTEGALVLAAAEVGMRKGQLETAFRRVAEVPFDSKRKRMTTVHSVPDSVEQIPEALRPVWERSHLEYVPDFVAFTKGAIDGLLQISDGVFVEGRVEDLDDEWRKRVMEAHDSLAAKGMRILGVAVRGLESMPDTADEASLERDLTLLGLVGMIDPPRPEVEEAVHKCKSAGIRTVMITGDHPLTARHIAAQLGIASDDKYMIGQDLDQLSEQELLEAVRTINVFARVSPEHKLRLVEALQSQKNVVAMTGDGVNDAPALKRADIGVAMGITGTDVSKEAAEMVLLDDNFATIVAAVEEGRVIYENIRKFIKYLLSCNSAEILVMLFGPFLGMPLPLLPLQILWMNLVTDGLPALALGVEPAEADVMERPPNPSSQNIFDRILIRGIAVYGIIMTLVSLGVGFLYWRQGLEQWQTMTFTTLVLSQIAMAVATRGERVPLHRLGIMTNRSMLGAVVLTFLLQLAVIYVPFMQNIFSTDPLSLQDLGLALVLSLVALVIAEITKIIVYRRTHPAHG